MTGAQNVALNVPTFYKGLLSQKRGRFSRTLLQGFIGLILQFSGFQTFFDAKHLKNYLVVFSMHQTKHNTMRFYLPFCGIDVFVKLKIFLGHFYKQFSCPFADVPFLNEICGMTC